MNNFLDRLDKYKYGMIVMVALFILSNVIRIHSGFVQRPDISYLLNEKPLDVIELHLEPEEMVMERLESNTPVANAVNDQNSKGGSGGESSPYENRGAYSNSQSLKDVERSVYELERSMFEEAGGAAQRDAIRGEMEAKKRQLEEQNKNKSTSSSSSSSGQKNSSENRPGNVLVSFDVKGRSGSYVPAPGYMCPQGTSGVVVVSVKVDLTGKVIEARVNSGGTECMNTYSLQYAKKSKFSPHSTGAQTAEGTITYTFVN